MDGSRRAFLRGSLLSRDGRAQEARRQQPLGPPPPWHLRLPLADYCLDCPHPCTDACEPGIIKIHPQAHTLAGLPYLDFSLGGCTFCRACVTACPIEIDASTDKLPVIGTVQLNRATCIAWDDVICMSCSGRCDYQAITTTYQRRAQVNAEVCNGCGMCVHACPVNALAIA